MFAVLIFRMSKWLNLEFPKKCRKLIGSFMIEWVLLQNLFTDPLRVSNWVKVVKFWNIRSRIDYFIYMYVLCEEDSIIREWICVMCG